MKSEKQDRLQFQNHSKNRFMEKIVKLLELVIEHDIVQHTKREDINRIGADPEILEYIKKIDEQKSREK